jgi:uncharacterized protein (TIGR02302 family)
MPFSIPHNPSNHKGLRWSVRLTHAGLVWGKLWPVCVPILVVALFWLTYSWLGFWFSLAPYARYGMQVVMGVSFVTACFPFARELFFNPWPTHGNASRALESHVAHTPLSALHDALATGQNDSITRTLWEQHQTQMAQKAAQLSPSWPSLGMSVRDRYGLRSIMILAALGALFIAGEQWKTRLASAFIAPERLALAQAFRLDGWIDPPAYTRLAPIVLQVNSLKNELSSNEKPNSYRVPINSIVLVRVAGGTLDAVSFEPSEGLKHVEPNAKPNISMSELREHRFVITQSSTLDIVGKRFWGIGAPDTRLAFEIIPDNPPVINIKRTPQRSSKGGLSLSYTAKDDYGIASLEAVFAPLSLEALSKARLAPPRVALSLASATPDEVRQSVLDLAEHPWAGAQVNLTLVAKDEAGQEGSSQTLTLTLPQRVFTKPVPKALAVLRRELILDRESTKKVLDALYAMQIAPEIFIPSPSEYLGLRVASTRLEEATQDDEVIEVAGLLWEMAVRLEDGDLSDSQKALKAAQEALQLALQNGASPAEIQRLTQEMRKAMDRFLKDMQANSQGQNRTPSRDPQSTSKGKSVTPDQLSQMLKRIEELTQNGQTAEAQQLLEQLKDILNNLRMASPSKAPSPQGQAAQKALKDLGEIQKDQEGLRDETYQHDQKQFSQGEAGEDQQDVQRQEGQKRDPLRRDEHDEDVAEEAEENNSQDKNFQDMNPKGTPPSQRKKLGKNNQEDPHNTQTQEQLSQRQQTLNERLGNISKNLSQQGIPTSPDLKDAQSAMKEAQKGLQKGQNGEAQEAQADALKALTKAQQALKQQMQGQGQEQGEGEGDEQSAEGEGGEDRQPQAERGDAKDDPLGRQTRQSRNENGRFTRQGSRSSLELKIEDVIRELRKRLGDPQRSREEIDYLERLLKAR